MCNLPILIYTWMGVLCYLPNKNFTNLVWTINCQYGILTLIHYAHVLWTKVNNTEQAEQGKALLTSLNCFLHLQCMNERNEIGVQKTPTNMYHRWLKSTPSVDP